MPFLFIIDPLECLNAATDTSLALMAEAQSRGVDVFACEIGDIFLKDGLVHFMCAPVRIAPGYTAPPAYEGGLAPRSASQFRAIFMRKDPPVDSAFFSALLMLRCYDPEKTVMINDPDGLILANEKLFGQKIAPDFYPSTLVATDKKLLTDFAKTHGRVVIKPLFGAGGAGVLVMEENDRNLASGIELLTSSFTYPVMMQAFIKNARSGDKRIIIVGGKPLGAILRVPSAGDHRANFHAGGSAQATTLTDREKKLVEHLAPHLLAHGLHFVGIDVIDGYLTEINVTSPTCVLEIEAMSQAKGEQPLRAQILDYVMELIGP